METRRKRPPTIEISRQRFTMNSYEVIETPLTDYPRKLRLRKNKARVLFRGSMAECREYISLPVKERPKSLNLSTKREPYSR
jgi:hypothetical protein